jgi:hypothetical protein
LRSPAQPLTLTVAHCSPSSLAMCVLPSNALQDANGIEVDNDNKFIQQTHARKILANTTEEPKGEKLARSSLDAEPKTGQLRQSCSLKLTTRTGYYLDRKEGKRIKYYRTSSLTACRNGCYNSSKCWTFMYSSRTRYCSLFQTYGWDFNYEYKSKGYVCFVDAFICCMQPYLLPALLPLGHLLASP